MKMSDFQEVATDLWPIISATFDTFGRDERIMERNCRALRFTVRCLGTQSAPLLQPLVEQVSQHIFFRRFIRQDVSLRVALTYLHGYSLFYRRDRHLVSASNKTATDVCTAFHSHLRILSHLKVNPFPLHDKYSDKMNSVLARYIFADSNQKSKDYKHLQSIIHDVVENAVAPDDSNKRSSKVFLFFISQILVSLDTISD